MIGGLRELLWQPLLERRRRLGWIAGSLFVLTAAQSVFLLLIKGFTAVLLDAGPPSQVLSLASLLPKGVETLLGTWGEGGITRGALGVAVPAGLLAAGLLRAYAHYVYQVNQQSLAIELAGSYRQKLFRAVLAQPYAEVRRRSAGEWMSIIVNDVHVLEARFCDVMAALVRGGATVVAGILAMSVIHWPSGIALTLLAPFAARGMGKTGQRIAGFADAVQRELGRLSATVLDFRARLEFIRAQGAEEREHGRFRALTNGYYRMIRRSILVRSAFAPTLELVGFIVFAGFVLAVARGYAVIGPDLLLQFFAALGLLLKPLREIGEQLALWGETRGALYRSASLYAKMSEDRVADPSEEAPDRNASFSMKSVLTIQAIEIAHDGVRAFYSENLSLPWSKPIAIIGPSGAGKSTLVKSLGGLFEPTLFHANWSWRDTAALTAMVNQDPFLFDDTLRTNLLYGLGKTTEVSDHQIWDALLRVNIANEVRALPDGLETRMRTFGPNVSGGQLQRLTIARALLRSRPILLLDEATSAVDERTERDITERLTAACRFEGTALVAVTHRLRFLDAYDEVWFVEGGSVALRGTHRELLGDARYARYCAVESGSTP